MVQKVAQVFNILTFLWLILPLAAHGDEKAQFNEFYKQANQTFASYIDEQEQDYAAYRKAIEEKWGEFITSTRIVWVDYGNEKETRSRVDFKRGEVTIDALVPAESKSPDKVATNKIAAQLKRMISDKWPTGESPLAGQISVAKGQALSDQNIEKFVQEKITDNLNVHQELVPQKNAPAKRIVSVKIPLVPKHIELRAGKYKALVDKYSKLRDLDPTVVFGVIHTESYFNPMARSHVPAFGLMQIVPASGGRDAYRFAFGEDTKPSSEFLYNPDNNINLGTAYLALTKNKYFKGITDPAKAYLLTVASYNTGPGNVAKALTGKTQLQPAVAAAQQMSADQVYKTLRIKLPYDETKEYVQRVFSRAKIYRGF